MEKLQNTQKVSFGKKIGYIIGGATDTIAFDFVAAFLLFFLTDFAGVSPAWAGAIISLGVVWDMITDPIIGNLSDRTKTRIGKRRPWLLAALIIVFISYMLLFTKIDGLSQTATNIYFLCMTLMFWLGYTCFVVPYYAMGASMTSDNNERTKIRMMGMIVQYMGTFFSTVAPTMFVSFFKSAGLTDYHAWHYTAWIECGLFVITLIIVFFATKDVELDFEGEGEEKNEKQKGSLIKDFISVFKIKTYLLATLSSLLFKVGYCLFLTAMAYFFLYVVGLPEIQMSVCTSIISFGGIIVILVLMRLVNRFDKVKVYWILVLLTGLIMIGFNFIEVNSLGMACVFCVFYIIGSSAYWSINFPIMYDSIEIDEFQRGIRREGTMVSVYLFVQKAGYAIAAAIIGNVLAKVGYDETLGAANPEPVLDAIQTMICGAAGFFFVLSAVIMLLYPLKKDVYNKLYIQLENKRAGRAYNTEGFESILNKKYR